MKLQDRLEAETKKTKRMQTLYTQQTARRTELQVFLKKCVEDVRADLLARRKQTKRYKPRPKPSIDPRDISPDQFSPGDRITTMEWLIAQDHIIYTLYDNIFPRR